MRIVAPFLCLIVTFMVFACSPGGERSDSQLSDLGEFHLNLNDSSRGVKAVPNPVELTTRSIPLQSRAEARVIPAERQIQFNEAPESYPLYQKKKIALPESPKSITEQYPRRKIQMKKKVIPYQPSSPIKARPFFRKNKENSLFENLDSDQGLPNSVVTDLLIDSRGMTWLGTAQGLFRYDGKYFYPIRAEEGLEMNIAKNMVEAANGDLWIAGGAADDLVRFDGTRLETYSLSLDVDPVKQFIKIIGLDLSGKLWLECADNLVVLDGEEAFAYPGLSFLNERQQDGFITDSAGNHYHPAEGGFLRFSGEEIEFYGMGEEEKDLTLFPFHADEQGRIFFTTDTDIVILEEDSLTFLSSEFTENHPFESVWKEPGGGIWGWHYLDGVTYLEGGVQKHFTGENGPLSPLIIPNYKDKFGRKWFASLNTGVHRMNELGFRHYMFQDIFDFGAISALTRDQRGNLWIGSHGFGLARYDGASFTSYPTFNQEKRYIRAMQEDQRGNIWLGSFGEGITRFDGVQFTDFRPKSESESLLVYALEEDQNGQLWVGSYEQGLLALRGDEFISYTLEQENSKGGNFVRSLLEDSEGNLWIGYEKQGLLKYDGKSFFQFNTENGLPGNKVVSLMEDRAGNIWIGTANDGLAVLSGNQFQYMSTGEGLASNSIWTLTEDGSGNIWIGAGTCLNVLMPDSLNAFHLGANFCDLNGMRGGEFYANATLMDPNGQIWWGSDKSLITVNPEELLQGDGTPTIHLDHLELNQFAIDFHSLLDTLNKGTAWKVGNSLEFDLGTLEFDSVSAFFNYPLNLILPPEFNNIQFSFTAMENQDPERVQYSFLMEGLDRSWSDPVADATVAYRGLDPGKYVLRTRARGEIGGWSEVFTYSFRIRPPWWASTLALLIWGLLGLALIYSVARFFLRQRIAREEAARIRELDGMRSRLYTNITHEFRTPLTVIMGLSAQIEGHEKERSLIRRNSQRLLRLINQMLDLARLESGSLKLDPIQLNVISFLKILSESFQSLASEKGVKFTFYPEEEEIWMDLDQEKFAQIVYNLLANAIKFTPEGGEVIFHVARKAEGGEELLLKVRDSGRGIAAAQLPFIFDRFFQASETNAGREGGTGIGLALARDLVELMGGTIRVESEVAKGTEFSISIPITRKAPLQTEKGSLPAELTEIETPASTEIPESSENPESPELLIVEDNADVMTYLRSLLQHDYQLRFAQDGAAGIAKALETIPDLILSDVMMPEKDGFELCETLKSDPRTSHIPIVLLTAKAGADARLEGIGKGADAYLSKPFSEAELRLRLEQLLLLRRKLREKYSGSEAPPVTTDPGPEDQFLSQLRADVLAHLDDPNFGVPQLGTGTGMSQMQVYRKLKALTGKTPSRFIRSVRLQQGRKMVLETDLNISEIAYAVGFSDPNYFSRTFNEEFGTSPRDLRG